jgi:hypothetical protein
MYIEYPSSEFAGKTAKIFGFRSQRTPDPETRHLKPYLVPAWPGWDPLKERSCRKAIGMDEEEYQKKYVPLRILKSIQEYLKDGDLTGTAVYPINVPNDLILQILEHQGSKPVDDLIHEIFRIGLRIWAENLFMEVFGSTTDLESFLEEVKSRNRKTTRA